MSNKIASLQFLPNYELEFRLEDHELIKSILRNPNIEKVGFEDSIVTTYEPDLKISNIKYRSILPVNPYYSSERFEKKELIYKTDIPITLPIIDKYISTTPNPLISEASIASRVSTKLIMKYSLETSCSSYANSMISINNVYRKVRVSYKVPTLKFRLDLTARYFPTKDIHDLDLITFTPKSVLDFQKIEGFNLVTDLEFELCEECENINDEYSKLICFISNYDYNAYSELRSVIPFDFTSSPQVGILTTDMIKTSSKDDFVWSDKMDGIRHLIILYKNDIYTWTTVDKLKYFDKSQKYYNSPLVLDTEKIDNTFYIFDIYVYNGQDVRDMDYISRLNLAKNEFEKTDKIDNFDDVDELLGIIPKTKTKTNIISSINTSFKILQTHPINNWSELIKYAFEERNNTDGVVLHSIQSLSTSKFWYKEKVAFKLKPTSLNTIDFLYKYINSTGIYQLYLCGDASTYMHVLRDRSRYDKYSQEIFGYDLHKIDDSKSYNILFDSPYFENMWKYNFKLDDVKQIENLSDAKGVKQLEGLSDKASFVKQIEDLNSSENCLTKQALFKPSILNNLIIESKYIISEKRWKPIRIRYDKKYPNNYEVGLTNTSLLFSPPNGEICDNSSKDCLKKLDISLRLENIIRTYIYDFVLSNKDKYLPFNDSPIVLIDYNSGEGKDIPNYYACNVKKIFAISDDDYDLVRYVNNLKNVYTSTEKQDHVINILNRVKQKRICLNVFKNNNETFQKLISSSDFKIGEVNMIVINNLNNTKGGDDFEKLSEIYNLCNSDCIILYVYVGDNFDEFRINHFDKIIDSFTPLLDNELCKYIYSNMFSKSEVDAIQDKIRVAIMKI